MLIVMDAAASAEDIARVVDTVQGLGLQAHPIPGAQRTAIGITGNRGAVDRGAFENLPGVTEVIPVSAPYKLVSREAKRENTVVSVGGVPVGGERLAVAAGPCAVESEARALEIGRLVRDAGANLYRGGAYKPRTSPYSFQGLGAEGLKILSRVRAETGLPIVTEVLDTETVDLVAEHADCLQVGARNMQNFSLLKRLGRIQQARAPEAGHGGHDRGAASVAPSTCWPRATTTSSSASGASARSRTTRATRSISPPCRTSSGSRTCRSSSIPSHGTGKRAKVLPLSRAAVAVGADGLLIEVHDEPEHALSDGPQAILPDMFVELVLQMRRLAPVVGRTA